MTKRPLKSASHHWWPQGLSELWANSNGEVTRQSWDGTKVSASPGDFGTIFNGHHIKYGAQSPWDMSIEPEFDEADTDVPFLVQWLLTLESKATLPKAPIRERLLSQSFSEAHRQQLAKLASSLVIRSPRNRSRIRRRIDHTLKSFGANWSADKNLIAANLRGCHSVLSKHLCETGGFVALFTRDTEFIFGDGFLHTYFPTSTIFNLRCVIPLLPCLTIIYSDRISRNHSFLNTITLRSAEVRILNAIVQVYSCDAVFYRSQKPDVFDAFFKRGHFSLEHDTHPLIDEIVRLSGME